MPRQPQLTSRLQRFGTTIFTEMSALSLRHDAVNLGQGFPDFDAPAALTEAAQRAIGEGRNQYAPGNGIPSLRRAVAGHAARHHGLDYDPDTEVTVTTGATEAIFCTLNALCDIGDEVVLIEPFYDVHRVATSMAGAVARGVPLRAAEDGGWRLDEDDLRAATSRATRVIVINAPMNPLGKTFSLDELGAVVRVAEEVDAVILSDEVYEHLVFDGAHRSVCHVPGGMDRTVRISSAAKTFSVTGWKVGWACAPPAITDALRAAKQWTTFTSGTPFQHAVADALGWDGSYFEPMAADYLRRRDLLCEALDDIGFGVTVPDGTFFVACDTRPLGFDDDLDLCRRMPSEIGVGAIPTQVFHEDPSAHHGLVRFAFCKTDEALAEGIERLRSGLPGMARPDDR